MASEVTPEKEAYIRGLRGLDIGKVRTARDPETEFVYPVFPDRVVSPKDEQPLKLFLDSNYQSVLESLLKQYGHIHTCANRLVVLTTPEVEGDILFDIGSLSAAERRDLERREEQNQSVAQQLLRSLREFPTRIEQIKKEFQECPVPYYVLFVKVVAYRYGVANAHANILILNKAKGTLTWIDPEIRDETADAVSYLQTRKKAFLRLTDIIGLKSPRIFLPAADICPQIFTGDVNCLYWSLLTILLFILNPRFTRQDDLYAYFYTAAGFRLPDGFNVSSEKLLRYIENFKASLLLAPEGGRRKTQRRKHRRRKTRRY